MNSEAEATAWTAWSQGICKAGNAQFRLVFRVVDEDFMPLLKLV